jgi:hypothetical protein
MFNLDSINEYTKAILAIVIGEYVINMLSKGEGFKHSRKTLDLCWKCIEKWENIEDDVIDDLCNCLCSDYDEEFEYYSKISEDATNSNIYLLLCGIASYVDAQVMIEQKEALPQYLEIVEDDDGYTECILDVVNIVNDNYFEDYKLQQVLTYCQEKQKENKNIKFSKEEILKISF